MRKTYDSFDPRGPRIDLLGCESTPFRIVAIGFLPSEGRGSVGLLKSLGYHDFLNLPPNEFIAIETRDQISLGAFRNKVYYGLEKLDMLLLMDLLKRPIVARLTYKPEGVKTNNGYCCADIENISVAERNKLGIGGKIQWGRLTVN